MIARVTLGGSYPRKEELVKATWNFDKGLVGPKELERQYDAAARELLGLQERLGFVPVCDGLLSWPDIFRPLVETSAGFEVGGVTRLFETNRFFRQPVLKARPALAWERLQAYFPAARLAPRTPWKAILPSPYWFARVTKDDGIFDSEEERGYAIAEYVNAAARGVASLGAAAIQFNEALLFYEKEPDLGFCNELFDRAVKGLRVPTIANFVNGNAVPGARVLITVPTTAVGIDFVETPVKSLPKKVQELNLLAQVVNGQESLLESPAEVRRLLGEVQERLKPLTLEATHTWDLEFVPSEVAAQKLEVLAQLLPSRKVAA